MADEKTPLERLVETAVYAPLGIAALIREELPKLVTRGQQEANMAKMMGQFAVGMGRQELEKRLNAFVERGRPGSKPEPRPSPASTTTATPASARAATTTPSASSASSANGQSVTVHDANSLAIPGYDSLSASQVVQRLAGLNAVELAAIGSYEAAGRGRRTILNRVAQLRDS